MGRLLRTIRRNENIDNKSNFYNFQLGDIVNVKNHLANRLRGNYVIVDIKLINHEKYYGVIDNTLKYYLHETHLILIDSTKNIPNKKHSISFSNYKNYIKIKNYLFSNYDKIKGDIEYFPTEILEYMLLKQLKNDNILDITKFYELSESKIIENGNGDVDRYKDYLMANSIIKKDFNIYYKTYPTRYNILDFKEGLVDIVIDDYNKTKKLIKILKLNKVHIIDSFSEYYPTFSQYFINMTNKYCLLYYNMNNYRRGVPTIPASILYKQLPIYKKMKIWN